MAMPGRVHKSFPTTENLPKQLEFISLQFDANGYRVVVSEFAVQTPMIFEVDFGKMPLAQRSMDEGKFLATSWKADPDTGPIVLVEGSDFLVWFHRESCGMYEVDKVFHVAILTQNEWVEVICDRLPMVNKLSGPPTT